MASNSPISGIASLTVFSYASICASRMFAGRSLEQSAQGGLELNGFAPTGRANARPMTGSGVIRHLCNQEGGSRSALGTLRQENNHRCQKHGIMVQGTYLEPGRTQWDCSTACLEPPPDPPLSSLPDSIGNHGHRLILIF